MILFIKVLDASKNFSCFDCLRKDVMSHLERRSTEQLSIDFSIRDLRDILDEQEFNNYLDVALHSLVSNDFISYLNSELSFC